MLYYSPIQSYDNIAHYVPYSMMVEHFGGFGGFVTYLPKFYLPTIFVLANLLSKTANLPMFCAIQYLKLSNFNDTLNLVSSSKINVTLAMLSIKLNSLHILLTALLEGIRKSLK